jgi:hypothetical protein
MHAKCRSENSEKVYSEDAQESKIAIKYRRLVLWDVTLQAVCVYQPVTLTAEKAVNLILVPGPLVPH